MYDSRYEAVDAQAPAFGDHGELLAFGPSGEMVELPPEVLRAVGTVPAAGSATEHVAGAAAIEAAKSA